MPAPSDPILVAAIVRPHGLRGEVVVDLLSDVADRLAPGSELLLLPGGERRRLVSSRPSSGGRRAVLRLEGCEGREEAELLRGRELAIEADRVPAAPPGSFYYFQLLGCRCRDRNAGILGRVESVVEDGGGVLLALRDETGRELLVPFVEPYLRGVDIEAGAIELELPEGLVETCTSRS